MSITTKPDDVEVWTTEWSYYRDYILNWIVNTLSITAQVRFADQEKINEFGRLNNRLLEVSAELKQSKEDNEKLDDASAELMMANSEGKIMLLIGEAFIETSEEDANECKIIKWTLRTYFPMTRLLYGMSSRYTILSINDAKRTNQYLRMLDFLFSITDAPP